MLETKQKGDSQINFSALKTNPFHFCFFGCFLNFEHHWQKVTQLQRQQQRHNYYLQSIHNLQTFTKLPSQLSSIVSNLKQTNPYQSFPIENPSYKKHELQRPHTMGREIPSQKPNRNIPPNRGSIHSPKRRRNQPITPSTPLRPAWYR